MKEEASNAECQAAIYGEERIPRRSRALQSSLSSSVEEEETQDVPFDCEGQAGGVRMEIALRRAKKLHDYWIMTMYVTTSRIMLMGG